MSSQVPIFSLSTPSQYPVIGIVGSEGNPADLSEYIPDTSMLPTGIVAATVGRNVPIVNNNALIASGRLSLYAIYIHADSLISNISFYSGTTAAATLTNQWFSIYSLDRVPLATTADDTTAAWAANTKKTLALSTPWRPTTSGLYYVGIVVVAGTMPSLYGQASAALIFGETPILAGQSTTGLTNPASAPNPAAALTTNAARAYVTLS